MEIQFISKEAMRFGANWREQWHIRARMRRVGVTEEQVEAELVRLHEIAAVHPKHGEGDLRDCWKCCDEIAEQAIATHSQHKEPDAQCRSCAIGLANAMRKQHQEHREFVDLCGWCFIDRAIRLKAEHPTHRDAQHCLSCVREAHT